jgi:hypothetical protein
MFFVQSGKSGPWQFSYMQLRWGLQALHNRRNDAAFRPFYLETQMKASASTNRVLFAPLIRTGSKKGLQQPGPGSVEPIRYWHPSTQAGVHTPLQPGFETESAIPGWTPCKRRA